MRSSLPGAGKSRLLRRWDQVLGLDLDRTTPRLDLPAGAEALLGAREQAREARNFQTADRLREELAALGVTVTDTAEGQRWKVSRK